MAAKSKSQIANDKTPFWTYPRTSLDDGICYHIRDQRKTKHADIEILEEHPLAKSDPMFENMVFVSREPADREGALVRDWYVPKTLVDDLLSVSKTGAGARSSLLYPVGTEPPEGDSRIPLLDHCRGEMTFDVAYLNYPNLSTEPTGTTNPSNLISLTRATGVSQFTTDEVYIDLTQLAPNNDTVIKKYVDGVVTKEFTTGVHQIVRHVNDGTGTPTIIHIEVPANTNTAGNTLGTGSPLRWTGTTYTAKYILEGTTDSEDAPGILRGKFLVRNFNYRLGRVGVTSQRDETIGVKVVTERRVVPHTWSYNWDSGYTTASTSTCKSSLGFAPVSELVTQQTKQDIVGVPDAQVDRLTWNGVESVSMPRIIHGGEFLWAFACATKGSYYAYDDDLGLDLTTIGGGSVKCPSKVTRRIVSVADGDNQSVIENVINEEFGVGGLSHLYTPSASTYTLSFHSWAAYSGSNTWAKARVRTWQISNGLVVRQAPFTFRISSNRPEPNKLADGIDGADFFSPRAINLNPYGSENNLWDNTSWVPWNIRVQKGKWCYWIIDFIWVKFPDGSGYQNLPSNRA